MQKRINYSIFKEENYCRKILDHLNFPISSFYETWRKQIANIYSVKLMEV